MKQNSNAIPGLNFTLETHHPRQKTIRLSPAKYLAGRIPATRELVQTGLAIVAIGAIIFGCYWLFFRQLAEYGW